MRTHSNSVLQTSPFRVGIKNVADYSPFGVQLNGRTFSSTEYRIGFQNQEKDDEIKGEGNSVNYKYRMHDPRVGRFFAVDPLTDKYPWYSAYQFSGNKVIAFVELEGLEEFVAIKKADSYILVWNIRAREDAKQRGRIVYVNESNDVIEEMRLLNEQEMGFSWIEKKLNTNFENAQLEHLDGGTNQSQGHPSTGVKGTLNGKVKIFHHTPAPLDFNVAPGNQAAPGSTTGPPSGNMLKNPPSLQNDEVFFKDKAETFDANTMQKGESILREIGQFMKDNPEQKYIVYIGSPALKTDPVISGKFKGTNVQNLMYQRYLYVRDFIVSNFTGIDPKKLTFSPQPGTTLKFEINPVKVTQ